MPQHQQCRPLVLLSCLLSTGLGVTEESEQRLRHALLDMEHSFEHVVDRDLRRVSGALVKQLGEEEAKEEVPVQGALDLEDASQDDLINMNHECVSCDNQGVCHPCGRITHGKKISSAEVEKEMNRKPMPKLEPEAQAAIFEALGGPRQVALTRKLKHQKGPHSIHKSHKSHEKHNSRNSADRLADERQRVEDEMREEIDKQRAKRHKRSEESDDIDDLEASFAKASGQKLNVRHAVRSKPDYKKRLAQITAEQAEEQKEVKKDEGDSDSASLLDEESGVLSQVDAGEAKIAEKYAARSMKHALAVAESHLAKYVDSMPDSVITDLLTREKAYEAKENPEGPSPSSSLLEIQNQDPEDGVNAVEKQVDTLSKTVDETYDKLDALKAQEAYASARPAMIADLQTTMGTDVSKTQQDAHKVLDKLRTVTLHFEDAESSLVSAVRDRTGVAAAKMKLNQVRDEADSMLVSVAATTKDLVTTKEDLQDTEGALSATDAPALDETTDTSSDGTETAEVMKATEDMMNDTTPVGSGADAKLTDAQITAQAVAAASGKGNPQDMATDPPGDLAESSDPEGDQAPSSLLDVGISSRTGISKMKHNQPPAGLQEAAQAQVQEKLREETLAGLNEHIENDLDHSADAANSTIADLQAAGALLVIGQAGLSQEGRDTSKQNDLDRLRKILAATVQDNDRAMAGAVTIRDDMQKASDFLDTQPSSKSTDAQDQDDNDGIALLEGGQASNWSATSLDELSAGLNKILRRED